LRGQSLLSGTWRLSFGRARPDDPAIQRGDVFMRALVMALAIASAAGAAHAQDNGAPGGSIRVDHPPPPVPGGARKQAEAAVRQGLADPTSAAFRAEHVIEVESVKHGFGPPIDGPVSVVCGQYAVSDGKGGQSGVSWFFAAIKHGQVLWTDVDLGGDPGAGYYGCKGAGLAS
jgi:hypothetical protein